MARPSDPLLAWLRQMADKRKLNTAALAEKAKLERARVRKILGGQDPMTVDELLSLTTAMELTPADMGLVVPAADAEIPETKGPARPTLAEAVDTYGNQARQMIEFGVALGCDLLLLAETAQLAASGVPKDVLARFPEELPIRLDAAYHEHIHPRFDEHQVTLTLGFDALYECRFPWSSLKRVVLFPAAYEPPPEETDEETPKQTGRPPFLRLVE